MLHVHMMEYCSALKKNEIMAFVGKWIELENIMLSAVLIGISLIVTGVEHFFIYFFRPLIFLLKSRCQQG